MTTWAGRRDWEWFVDETRLYPLIAGSPRVATRDGRVTMSEGTWKRVAPLGLFIALGTAAAWKASRVYAAAGADAQFWVFAAAAGLMLLLAVGWVLSRGAVTWRPAGEALALRKGTWPFTRTLDVPRSQIRVGTDMASEESDWRSEGHGVLYLRSTATPGCIRVASGSGRDELRRAVGILSDFLAAAAVDRTVRRLELSDGTVIHADVMPFAHAAAPRLRLDLSFAASGLAVYESACARWSILLPAGLLASAILVLAALVRDWSWPPALALAMASLALVRLLASPGLYCYQRVVADRERGTVRFHGRFGHPVPESLLTRDIAGVQVCSWHRGSGGVWDRYYEVDLVLRSPPGERVHLLSEPASPSVRDDAARFAQFLGVDFWDHSLPAPGPTGR